MPTIKLNWTTDPLTMKFSLDSDRMSGDHGIDQGRAVSALSSIPNLKFNFPSGRYIVGDSAAAHAIVSALISAGFTVEHEGNIPVHIPEV